MSREAVTNCPNPKCHEPIFSDHDYSWCTKCGESLPKNIQDSLPKLRKISQEAAAVRVDLGIATEADIVTATQINKSRRPFVDRYVDLYRSARLLVGIGTTVKTIGIVVGICIFLLWLVGGIIASAQPSQPSPFGPPNQSSGPEVFFLFGGFTMGAVSGSLVGGVVFLLGVLISAQGQILLAQADSAVHTSPFLTDDERLKIMSLPS